MLPPWLLVIILAVVFTAVLAGAQGLYWAWVAKREREQEELLRRLGSGSSTYEDEREIALFREEVSDSVAGSLGNIGEGLQTLIRKADVNYGVSTLITRVVILAGAGAVVGGLLFFPFGMVLGLPLAYLPVLIVRQQGDSRTKRLIEQLPDSLELMARALSAGLGLSDAFRLVGRRDAHADCGRIRPGSGRGSVWSRLSRGLRQDARTQPRTLRPSNLCFVGDACSATPVAT